MDFRGSFCKVQIYKGGTKYDVSNFPTLFNSIASVRAKVRAGNLSNISVEITPSFQDGIAILKSGLIGGWGGKGKIPQASGGASNQISAKSLDSIVSVASALTTASAAAGGSTNSDTASSTMPYIAVKFMYPDQVDSKGQPAESPWYTGTLMIPDLELGDGNMVITLHAQPNTGLLQSLEGVSTFKNVSALEAIKSLSSSLTLDITFDDGDTQTMNKLSSAQITDIFNEPKLDSIASILRRFDCYYIMSDGNESVPKSQLRIKSREAIAKDNIEYTFVMFRQIDPANNVYPMFSYKMDSPKSLFLSGAAFGSSQRVVGDDKSVEQFKVKAEDYDSDYIGNLSTAGGLLPKDDGSADQIGGSVGVKDASDPELTGGNHLILRRDGVTNEDRVKSKTTDKISSFIKVSFSVPGIPYLKVLSLVQVIIEDNIEGLSGPVQIQAVEHVWDSNGWTSEIEGRMSGSITAASAVSNYSTKPQAPLAESKSPTKTASIISIG